jgi:putative NADH-flavin reductase
MQVGGLTMKPAITGANGFVEHSVVSAALKSGHAVVAIVRSAVPKAWSDQLDMQVIHHDLDKPLAADWIELQGPDVNCRGQTR